MKPRDTEITREQAAELLKAPSGQRPRIYATWRGQIVKVPSQYYLDKYRDTDAIWLSGTTLNDLVGRK